ncbi:Uncharacterised protein [Alloiococcus otitis]|uniref:Uncharacterized protein n=1 Tax=Alloiococcus otitis ATCC 51267 TaxID=883081 RepID=K9E8Y5_9LACT|nr:hypothetical protein [Alloiococcus otitis]EKU93153.1 hypothetical protein HMPREF9698_01495 [Alloiococcus otitis ATCC 51267]SUU80674.1 Uncharacterised protein [Alloiococcus otitis]
MKIHVSYKAKNLEEVLQLLQHEEVTVQAGEPTAGDAEVTEEVSYSQEDLTELAVKANKSGKLSQVKKILDQHEIGKISQVPDDLVNVVGQALADLVEEE